MSPARLCGCPTPQIFTDDPTTCHKCGRNHRTPTITLSTSTTAWALAELVLGLRRHGDNRRRADSIVIFD